MKPILFSTPMVQAIIEGRKTQTRRVVKEKVVEEYFDYDDWVSSVGKPEGVSCTRMYEKEFFLNRCSYQVGDILWVRETFCPLSNRKYLYKANHLPPAEIEFIKWKPSIFMPKEACRLFLKVTDVRAERLHDISDEDARAEGVKTDYGSYRHGFIDLWKSINGEQSWNDNPFVYALTFEKHNQ